MQQPTVSVPGSAIGDHVGISWLLRDVGDVRLVTHGGTTIGQYSEFVMVPDRGFAFTSMTNCGPNGYQLNERLLDWALEHYLGVVQEQPEPLRLSADALAPYVGTYETIVARCEITARDGWLVANASVKPEMKETLRAAGEDPDEESPEIPLALLAGTEDRYVVPDGPAKGMKGFFTRDDSGAVVGVHLGGRLATRMRALVS
jgi:hypothetical protein